MSPFTVLEELFSECNYPVYAHTSEDGKELLRDHNARCIKYFKRLDLVKNFGAVLERYIRKKFADPSDTLIAFVKELFMQLILFHDFGKVAPEFQIMKMKNKEAPEIVLIDESARHSLISSLIYFDYYYRKTADFSKKEAKVLKRIILLNAYVISKHHTGLDSLKTYYDDVNYGNGQNVIKVLKEQGICGYRATSFKSNSISLNISNFDTYDYFYCRFVYSILVACDYYATTEYMNGVEKKELGSLEDITPIIQAYEKTPLIKSIRQFEAESYRKINLDAAKDINDLRNRIFLDAEKGYLENPDERIYYLKAPTGSGKTNMALNLSFHMMKDGKKLFYIYPFNTLIEQTWNTLREVFPTSILEKFSIVNSLSAMETKENCHNDDEYYQKALLDRQFLNDPCILSTHVSFFNLLFGSQKEALMGFYQLCDSVVILDEIQSYRNSIWAEIISMLQACAELMGMKIIIMSATLPDLTVLTRNEGTVKSLIKEEHRYFNNPLFMKRVKLSYELLSIPDLNLDKLKKHILTNHGQGELVLVEFINKKSAEAFYKLLIEADDVQVPVYCITGDDSIIEREKILNPIKGGQVKEAILIATQVVEAGVDIDMDVGYKDVSKLDSEEQFLGRINRSCRKKGIVYFFNLDKMEKIYLDDLRTDRSLTLLNPDMQELLQNKEFDLYYEKVLQMMRRHKVENTTEEGLAYFLEYTVAHLQFQEVSEHMKLIEDKKHCVSVFFCREIELEEGHLLDGREVWNQYKRLLMDDSINYAEKRVKLSEVRVQLNYFVYQVEYESDIVLDERIGELYYIESGEHYFTNGKLDRDKLAGKQTSFY